VDQGVRGVVHSLKDTGFEEWMQPRAYYGFNL